MSVMPLEINQRLNSHTRQGHNFAELSDIIRRRRGVIFIITAIFFGLAWAWSMTATPLYTAQTQILIDPRERRVMENGLAPRDFTSETGVALVESQMKVMTSDSLLLNVIAREKLNQDKEFGGREKGSFEFLRSIALAINLISDGSPDQRALKYLSKNISVKRADRAFMVEMKVTTKTAEKSARIANAVVVAFLENITDAHVDSTKKAGSALSSRLDDMKLAVKKAEDKIELYKLNNNIVGSGGKLVSEQQLGEVNNQLVQARAKVAELRSRIEQLQRFERTGGDISSLSEVVQSASVAGLKNQMAEVTRQEADLLTTLGPRHPQVISVQKQAVDLKKLMTEEIRRIAQTIRGDYDRAMGNEKALSATVEELKKDQYSASNSFVQLRELERDAEAAKNIYNSVLTRAREIGEQEKLDPSNVRVISQASIPHEKSWPPTGVLLPLSLFLGLGVGIGYAFLKEAGDDRLHSKSQIERQTGIPVIGALPAIGRFGRDGRFSEVIDKPQSKFAATIRKVFALGSFGKNQTTTKHVLVLSDRDNNARAILSMNLALLSASQGQRVLIIDSDFKTKTLTKQIGGQRSGIGDIMNGKANLSDVLLHDRRTGIYMLPASHSTGADVSGVTPALMEKIFNEARLFNLVIIDGGSIADESLASGLGRSVDDILLAVEYGKTKQNSLNEAVIGLREHVGKTRGIIMTHAPGVLVNA